MCLASSIASWLNSSARRAWLPGIGALANFLFHLRILDHALQNARPPHQNVVVLLFASSIGRRRFFLGALKVAAIQVDVGGIQVDRADSVMVRTLLVNRLRRLQVLERFAAQAALGAADNRLAPDQLRCCVSRCALACRRLD